MNEWSIYSNDKLLCELTHEQAAQLFNAWRDGDRVEVNGDINEPYWVECMRVHWHPHYAYRIKAT